MITWSELIQQGPNFSPNAHVYLSVEVMGHLVRMNFPLESIRSEGQLVFLDGMVEEPYSERESNP